MTKQTIKGYFVELRDDLILLKIASFYKYVDSLVSKSLSAVKHNTKKRQGGTKCVSYNKEYKGLLQEFPTHIKKKKKTK